MLRQNLVNDEYRLFEFLVYSFQGQKWQKLYWVQNKKYLHRKKLTIPFKLNRNKNISLPEPASISEKKKGFNEKVNYVVFMITDFVFLLSLLLKCSYHHMFICKFLYLLLKYYAESTNDGFI